VVGYGGRTINTLRLWEASTPDFFDFAQFSSGDFVGALAETLTAETTTRVLYPDDSTTQGKGLRFMQEYFLVACSLADLIRRFRAAGNEWEALPDKVAIQLNDTHPTMAVPELMRLLLDEAKLGWDHAWSLTRRTLAYTNHTLLPEALEKWPVAWFQEFLPRHLEIVTRSTAVFSMKFAPIIQATMLESLASAWWKRVQTASPDGAFGDRRLAQYQWRRGVAFQAAQRASRADFRRSVSQPLQQ
jgi:glucan phosphorylase